MRSFADIFLGFISSAVFKAFAVSSWHFSAKLARKSSKFWSRCKPINLIWMSYRFPGTLQFHPIPVFTHTFLPHTQSEVLKLASAECFPLIVTLEFQREDSFLSSLLPVTGPWAQVVLMSARILKLEKVRSWLGLCIYRQKNLCTLKEQSFLGCHLRSDLTSPNMKHGFLVLLLRGWWTVVLLMEYQEKSLTRKDT